MVKWFASFALTVLWFGFSAVPAQTEPVGVTETEFPEANAALIAATAAFFESAEASEVRKRGRPVLGLALESVQDVSAAPGAHALTRMGPVQHLTGYRITWYPTDRLLGTVDFMGTWQGNRNLVCGYLTWDLSDPDAPALARVAANFLSLEDLAGAPEVQVHRSLMEANCAFGEIDGNYAFFSVGG